MPRWIVGTQAALVACVLFSIVYTGEHYVVDAIVGAANAVAAWWLVQLALRPAPERRDQPAGR